jgi:hypothetical protein
VSGFTFFTRKSSLVRGSIGARSRSFTVSMTLSADSSSAGNSLQKTCLRSIAHSASSRHASSEALQSVAVSGNSGAYYVEALHAAAMADGRQMLDHVAARAFRMSYAYTSKHKLKPVALADGRCALDFMLWQ